MDMHTMDENSENCPKQSHLVDVMKIDENTQYLCPRCGFACTTADEYSQHLNEHKKSSKYNCHLCGRILTRHQQFCVHMKNHDKHMCHECCATFSTRRLLLKHERSAHGIRAKVSKSYICNICKKRFMKPNHLNIHMNAHTGVLPVKCNICDQSFPHDKSLANHMKSARHLLRVNFQEGKTLEIQKHYQCAECGARFYRQQTLFRHIDCVHSKGELFKCAHCDYRTNSKTNLKRHKECHSDIKRFVCEVCGVAFRALFTLKEHQMFLHSEDRHFTCLICDQSFKSKGILQRHYKTHSEDRPFKCQTCNKRFKRLSHLKRHEEHVHRKASEKDSQPASQKIKMKDGQVVSSSQNAEAMSIIPISNQNILSDDLFVEEFTHTASNEKQHLNPTDNQEALSGELLVKNFTHPASNANQQLNVVPAVNQESLSNELLVKEFTHPVASKNQLLEVPPISSVSVICNTDSHEMTKLIGMNSSSNLSSDPVSLCDLQLNKFCNLNFIPTQDKWTQTVNDGDTQPKADIQSVGVGTDPFPMHPDAGGLLSSLLDNSPSDDLSLGPSSSSKNIFEDCLPFSPGGGLAVYDDFAAQSPSGSDNMLFSNESFMSEMTENFVLG